MKVKDLLKVLVAEDLIVFLKTENGDEIELESIDGANYDNLVSQQYFVDIDYEDFYKKDLGGFILKADHIIDFDKFNECEVVELDINSYWAELIIKL